jgi:hypothetical protein
MVAYQRILRSIRPVIEIGMWGVEVNSGEVVEVAGIG